MRASGSDHWVAVTPARELSLEQSLDFIGEDECVEVTPASTRLRKVILDQNIRGRTKKRLSVARSS
jgi:GTP-binding protein